MDPVVAGRGPASACIAGALACGCVPLPAPTFETAPRFTLEQIAAIETQPQTRSSVEAMLGPADLRRDANRLWIYTWTDDYGAWELVPVHGRWSDNRAGPVESHRHLWTLRFDESGVLTDHDYLPDAKARPGDRFCTNQGVCIEHPVVTDDAEYGLKWRYDDLTSAVTLRGTALSSQLRDARTPGRCVVTAWVEAPAGSDGRADGSRGGLNVRVESSSAWARWQWLPDNAFARVQLPPGTHVIESCEDESGRGGTSESIRCVADEDIYVAIGRVAGPRGHSIALRVVATDQAQARIAGRALLLPAD